MSRLPPFLLLLLPILMAMHPVSPLGADEPKDPPRPPLVPPPIPPLPPVATFVQRSNVRIEHKTVDGATEVKIDENGTRIKISHRDGKNIVVTIQPPADDDGTEPEVEKYEAKDSDELEDKHPEAWGYYEKYGTGKIPAGQFPGAFPGAFPGGLPGGFPRWQPPQVPLPQIPLPQIPAPQFPGGPGNFRFPRGFPHRMAPNAGDDKLRAGLAAARDELKKLTSRLRVLAEQERLDRAELRKLADELQAVHKRLADSQSDTEEAP